ncbi:MAG: hypothetical protein IK006_07750 [Bacteroidaceae bacterium]|nr:hypothetical protein [Bacteroidaceae bacterium]
MLKRIALLLCLIMSCGTSCPQGYYCDRKGARLEYVRNVCKDGSFRWRHVMTVTGLDGTGTLRKMTTTSAFLKANGKPLYKTDVREQFTIRGDDVSADMGEAMASYIKARVGLNATGSGAVSVLPADMQPGDTLPPVVAQTKVGPLTYNVKVSERKVLREETLTVPAGTFRCMVVEEHKVESGPGHHRDVINLTWYSKGIGYVRHDTYIKGVKDTSEILQSID